MLNNKVILQKFKKFFSDYSEKIWERTNSLLILNDDSPWAILVRIKRWNLYVEHTRGEKYLKVLVTPTSYNLSSDDYIPIEEREMVIWNFLWAIYKELLESI